MKLSTTLTSEAEPPSKNVSLLFLGFFIFSIILLSLSSCDSGAAQKRQKDLDDLNAYIKNQKDSIDQAADRNWADVEASYNAKKAELERDTAKMSQEMRASYYQSQADWQNYKADFTKKAEAAKATSALDKIRKPLAMDGMKTDFTDITPSNIIPAYDHFVEVVKANKDLYTQEDWTVVNVTWKALKGRKREIAKDIKAGDMATITKKEIEYVGIKAANRPFADSEDDKKAS